nr:hypothetical protein BdHM001_36140 [Bdellovibrio sp. HM001]
MGAKRLEFDKLDENPELNEIVKNAVAAAFEKLDDNFETWAKQIEEVECRSRDGFISSNDGGWCAISFLDLYGLFGGGFQSKFNEEIQAKLNSLYEHGLDIAKESFISDHKEELEKLQIPEDKISYHDLYELKQGKLAEKLSEYEHECNSGEQSSVMLQVEAFINRSSRGEGRSIHIACAVNWEAPYHRRGKDREWFAQADIEFKSASELKARLTPALNKLVKKALS